MKKRTISKLFLYRYRFLIGYVILGVAFITLLVVLPLIAQNGLSDAEMDSASASYYLGNDNLLSGNIVDLPYHFLQKVSIKLFGLTAFAIKLPSIILGLILGLLLILLLNRWFKSNVSLIASCLIILSTPFLFLAGSGTPLIMIVFWPTLLLWLGSKIQGEKRPKPMYSFIFAIAMLLSIFTPYMVYFAILCMVFLLVQPHLRFVVKSLPKLPLVIVALTVISGFTLLGINVFRHPDTIMGLLFSNGFEASSFFHNIASGFSPVFSWHNSSEGVFLSPLISLPTLALALIGLFSTTKGFFASRNSIATMLLIFCIIITGFNPSAVIFIILPLSILTAHGIKYLLEKWYGLFPENPYARISALFPITLLFGIMIISGLLQYIYGYRYNPNIADSFSHNLKIISENLTDEVLVVNDKFDFYKILEDKTSLKVRDRIDGVGPTEKLAIMGDRSAVPNNYSLYRIITSPRKDNSDIIYLYTATVNQGE